MTFDDNFISAEKEPKPVSPKTIQPEVDSLHSTEYFSLLMNDQERDIATPDNADPHILLLLVDIEGTEKDKRKGTSSFPFQKSTPTLALDFMGGKEYVGSLGFQPLLWCEYTCGEITALI